MAAEMSAARYRRFVTELVWHGGESGTGLTEHGASMSCGCPAEWVPEHLLCLAADSSFMTTLLRLASEAGLEVLGYVSRARLEAPADAGQPPQVTLSPCIVVGSDEAARVIERLCNEAVRESLVSRVLHGRIHVSADVKVVAPDATVRAIDSGQVGAR